jgi:energy-coupling factor transporter ATP-binding protein EcfA2
MSEKLIIRNFGPITNVELDLRKVNVLIGDQGTGKSTVAKVLALINKCFSEVKTNQYPKNTTLVVGRVVTDEFLMVFRDNFFSNLNKFDLQNYLTLDTYISFKTLEHTFTFSKGVVNLGDNPNAIVSLLHDGTREYFYIPAFRESYILLRENYPAILNAKANLPFLLNSIGQYFNNYRAELKSFNFLSTLGIRYEFRNGSDLIFLKDGKAIKFEEASSAISSVVPMLVVIVGLINDIKMADFDPKITISSIKPLVIIEEPELNCYPTTQKKLVEFLVEKMKAEDYFKSNEYYCNLLLTTHSPYILSSLNNLMFAYKTGLEQFEEVDKIIPSKYWLNPKDVSAYRLNEGGISEEIIDKEGLIKTSKIDEASTILNTEFNKVFNLEFSVPK